MLERPSNQAAGLMDLAVTPSPKLMAMVAHGDEQAELPLLLRICAALVGFGYPVTVLDGTVRESANNPGLEQLLDYSHAPATLSDAPSWSVIPAAWGLQTLGSRQAVQSQSLADTGWMFPHESVIIVYSTAQTLVPLLKGSMVRPVLTVSTAKASLLTSYLALKRLLLKGRLEPTIVNVLPAQHAVSSQAGVPTASTGLRDYAKYFLDYEVNAFTIPAPGADDRPSASTERLALGLLESAMPLDAGWSPMPAPSLVRPGLTRTVGSH
jgi:hypothetical protein